MDDFQLKNFSETEKMHDVTLLEIVNSKVLLECEIEIVVNLFFFQEKGKKVSFLPVPWVFGLTGFERNEEGTKPMRFGRQLFPQIQHFF